MERSEKTNVFQTENREILRNPVVIALMEKYDGPVGIIDLTDSRVLKGNAQAAILFGYKNPIDLENLSLADLVTNDRKETLKEKTQQLISDGALVFDSIPYVRADGSLCWFKGTMMRIDADDRFYALVIGRDITLEYQVTNDLKRRIQIEETTDKLMKAFASSEQITDVLNSVCKSILEHFEANKVLIGALNPQKQTYELLASSRETGEFISDDGKLMESTERQDENVKISENRLKKENIIWIKLAPFPMKNWLMAIVLKSAAGFERINSVSIDQLRRFLDIGLRNVLLYSSLKDSHERMAAILEMQPNAVALLNRDGKILWMNAKAETLLEIELSDALGKSPEEAFAKDAEGRIYEKFMEFTARLKAGETIKDLEWTFKSSSGKSRRLMVFLQPLTAIDCFEKEGGIGLVTLTDETERRDNENKLSEISRFSTLSELSAGMAHEINNPLQGIMSMSEILKYKLSKTDNREMLGQIEIVIKEAERIARIVKSLVRLGKPEQGEISTYSFNESVENAASIMRQMFADNQASIELRLDERMPNVTGYKHSIFQAVMNLLTNARQAVAETPPDRPRKALVSTKYSPLEPLPIVLTVEDSGKGVPPEIKSRIFDPFFTTKRPETGSGLGLTMLLKILRDQNGEISLEDSRLGGAKFVIKLPVNLKT